jgi:predicted HicB family RNase H-like nuclease
VSTKNTERMGIYLTPSLKKDIKNMADETGYSVNQLTLMALNSLVANYEAKGMFIFVDLIVPQNK